MKENWESWNRNLKMCENLVLVVVLVSESKALWLVGAIAQELPETEKICRSDDWNLAHTLSSGPVRCSMCVNDLCHPVSGRKAVQYSVNIAFLFASASVTNCICLIAYASIACQGFSVYRRFWISFAPGWYHYGAFNFLRAIYRWIYSSYLYYSP